jgi:Schlafen, AlbA_2
VILRGVNLRELTLAHLQQLVDNRVPESKALEYKLALPSNTDSDKKEFLADVSAMANSDGGLIIYGMATERDETGKDTGVAKSCDGVLMPNSDAEVLRLTSMLQNSLDPQLTTGVSMVIVPVPAPNRGMLLLGVERSWIGPHRVTYQRTDRFYRRGEAGKYSPDTPELRRMFMESDSWTEEAVRFHENRIQEVKRSGLYSDHFCLIHVLPLGRMTVHLNPRVYQPDLVIDARPMMSMGTDWRHNAAGFKLYVKRAGTGQEHYVQWFRFGGVEATASSFRYKEDGTQPIFRVNVAALRTEISRFVLAAIRVMNEKLDVSPPYFLAATLSGIGGTYPWLEGFGASWDAKPADEDPITLPPITLLGAVDPKPSLQLWWDTLWQVFGLPQAPE